MNTVKARINFHEVDIPASLLNYTNKTVPDNQLLTTKEKIR